MGGAQKHMLHPYDNLDLTFGEWFNIANNFYSGGKFDEKLDGVNITWRYNPKSGKIHIARNWGHIRHGAPTLDEYEESIQNHPAKTQMTNAIIALRKIEPSIKYFNFSMLDCKWWFNMEYISPNSPQTIRYDEEALVIHNITTLVEADETSNKPYMKVLEGYLDLNVITNLFRYSGVNVCHKSVIDLPKSYDSYYFDWLQSMHNIMKAHDLGAGDTLREYIYRCVVKDLNISWHHASKLADNVTGVGTKNHKISDVRKHYGPMQIERINQIALSKNRLKTINKYMKPMKILWDEFGAKRLEGITSNLINDTNKCLDRLKRCMEFNKQVLSTKYYNTHRNLWNALQLDVARFENLDVESIAIEGLVINYKGYKYKLTGAFPAVNRICGAARYSVCEIFPEDWEIAC